MLTRRGGPPRTAGRLPALLAAVGPTAGLAHGGLVAATVGLATAPTILTLASGGDGWFGPSVVAGIASGAALGWATDDPAAELLASMPVASPFRTAVRVALATLVAVAGVVVVTVAVAVGPGLPAGHADRLLEGGAAGASAVAVGLVAARLGRRGVGATAVIGGALGTAVVGALAVRFSELPSFTPGPHRQRWWLLVGAAALVAAHAGRDPARRSAERP